jgi:hypothetical protein
MSARLRFTNVSPLEKWRYRLGVRTEDSQSSNPGSIPGSATNYSLIRLCRLFCYQLHFVVFVPLGVKCQSPLLQVL